MKLFRDGQGREWALEINVAAIKRVRSLTGIDLFEAGGTGFIEKAFADPICVHDATYALCKSQCDERGIDEEAFGRAMLGDAIGAARDALLDELINFSSSPASRANLKLVVESMERLEAKKEEALRTQLPNLETAMLEQMEAGLRQSLEKSKTSSGNVLESSA